MAADESSEEEDEYQEMLKKKGTVNYDYMLNNPYVDLDNPDQSQQDIEDAMILQESGGP